MIIFSGRGACPKCGQYGAYVVCALEDTTDATQDMDLIVASVCKQKGCEYGFSMSERLTFMDQAEIGLKEWPKKKRPSETTEMEEK